MLGSTVMKRVLIVVYGFGYGGIRAFITNSLSHMDLNEIDVDIYVFGADESPFTQQMVSLGVGMYFEKENISNMHLVKFVSKLVRFMKERGPYDVVHANNNLISAWVLLAAKIAKVPTRLAHSHTACSIGRTLPQILYSKLRRWLIELLATQKLACGQLAGETMYGKGEKFIIINNGIDVNRFLCGDENSVRKFREEFDIPESYKVYANVTRLDISKNHLFAIDIFKEIHKKEPKSIFLYGGVTPNHDSKKEEIELKIKKYGLENYVRYTGPVKNIEQLYHLTDLWLYCSKYEGLPFGPIELQAASIPVLASDVITKEIDLGLGLVKFLSLNDSPETWANIAINTKMSKLLNEL